MTRNRLALVSLTALAVATAVLVFTMEGAADDSAGAPLARQPHPQADALSPSYAAAIAGIQSHARYDDVRSEYIGCMQVSYADFTGEFDAPVTLSDGSIFDRQQQGGRVVTPAIVELFDVAAECQDSSGYTALLTDAGIQGRRFPDAAETSPRTQFIWECITDLGHEVSRPVGDALPLPLYPDSGDPELLEDLRTCLEGWNGTPAGGPGSGPNPVPYTP
jgi:hypothetical protein